MTEEYTSLDDFEPWEIEAYLDNVPIDHLAKFLAQNPDAQRALALLKMQNANIQSTLYRFDCPEPALLQAYHLDELDRTQQSSLESHLHHCPHCSAEIAEMRAFAAEPFVMEVNRELLTNQPADRVKTSTLLKRIEDWVDEVLVIVATLVTPNGPQVAGAALRSEATASHTLLFEAGDVDISLTANRRIDGSYRIDGQLFALTPLSAATYTLTHSEASVEPITGVITPNGLYVANRIPAGFYQLALHIAEQVIVIPNLKLE